MYIYIYVYIYLCIIINNDNNNNIAVYIKHTHCCLRKAQHLYKRRTAPPSPALPPINEPPLFLKGCYQPGEGIMMYNT